MAEPETASQKGQLEKHWEVLQTKTFTKWINSHLRKRKLSINSLQDDFADGILLIQFLEIISNQNNFAKYEKKPRIKIQQIGNVKAALEFVKSQRVKLVNISAEDIVDKNLKLILGLIWTIIQRFQIEDISEEELSAKEALLLWCKKKTAGYRDVNVQNFHFSFQDGLAFCALIHKHRPDLIDFDSLDKNNKAANLQLAFDVADSLGIAKLLDVEDVADIKPDEKSIITYVVQYYHYFASSQKGEIAGRRIGKLVDITEQNQALKNDFLSRAQALVNWINNTTGALSDRTFDNTLEGARQKISEFKNFKTAVKPPKTAEKIDLDALFNNIALKLRNQHRPPFVPPEELSPAHIDTIWKQLNAAEDDREKALRDELARQEKLDYLRRRHALKAEKLEAWIAAKENYLGVDEAVSSLNEAQTKLKVHDAFDEEYANSKPRVTAVQELAAEIVKLSAPDASEIQARTDALANRWSALSGPQASKRDDLQKKLEKEQKKEELRLEFARQAKDYNAWNKEQTNAVNDHNFGDTLEAVAAFKDKLDATDAEYSSTSTNKKASLDDLWNQLQALGVNENRYTPLTNKDIQNSHDHLLQELEKRRAAYKAEYDRQVHLEEKRKEFAQKAQEFVDSLAARTAAINGLTGEPAELISAIKSTYDDGKPENEKLAALTALQNELSSLGIRDNKYTTYNLPILQGQANKLANHVRNTIAALNDEQELKEEYATRAAALIAWVNETIPTLQQRNFDNTLAGARAQSNELTSYKTTSRATKDIEKINVEGLFNTISNLLAKNNRPTFVPSAGNDVASINSAWDNINTEEKGREEAVAAELHRQEKLASLVKRFNSDAEDIEHWVAEKEGYVSTKESVDTLDAARLKHKFLGVFQAEFSGKQPNLDALKALQSEINGLNYIDASTVNARAAAIEASFARFNSLVSEKEADLKAALDREQGKEDLRVQFANQAKEFSRFVRDSVEVISDYNFGFTLEDVTAHAAELDKSDAEIKTAAAQHKAAIDATNSSLAAAGVSDNRHTKLTAADVENSNNQLNEALQKRRDAYNAELERQTVNEGKRKEFASQAQTFAAWVDEQAASLKKLEGSPEERIAATEALHQAGAPGAQHIATLTSLDSELKGLGVYDNKHTPYSLNILQTRNNQFDTSVKNFVSDLNEEKELNTRAAALQAEYDARLALENLHINFNKAVQELNAFLENANDTLSDPIKADTVEDVQELQSQFDAVSQQVPSQTEKFNSLNQTASELQGKGVNPTGLEEVTNKWAAFQSDFQARSSALSAEHARQSANEALRVQFANSAKELQDWIDSHSAAVNAASSGSLEDQLADVKNRKADISAGSSKLSALETLNTSLDEAGVTSNRHTSLTFASLKAAYSQLLRTVGDKESLIQKEIIAKAGQGITPEQFAEFKEVFEHFDKDSTGNLSRLEFKSCLQSLGEDPTDADLDKLVGTLGNDGKIPFDAFVQHMSQRAADSDTKEQILEAFKIVAGDKDFVTAEDLRKVLPNEKVDYLIKNIPLYKGIEGSYDYSAWASSAFSG